KQSQGSIWVYTELGKGSTFKIYLPAAPGLAEADPATIAASRETTGTETVLVVEDQDEVRRLIVETLRRRGYRVLSAANEREALSLAHDGDQTIDVLLTDVVLPGLSGRELARRIVAERPTLRVLYMSGYTDDAIVRHGVLDPGLAFLQKPFTADALLARIRDVLEAHTPPAA